VEGISALLIDAARSALLVVDVQERLAPAVRGGEACIERCRLLIEAARRLEVPVIASEQYPKGLGPTVPALAGLLAPEQIYAKRHFSCTADPRLRAALQGLMRPEIVICGMEAHVCVLQTALGLRTQGLQPIVVADAVASRRAEARALALERMRAAGVEIVDAEMVLFEWLREAGTAEFKALAPLIR
jgi:nicotinamidase-related amidase